MYHTISYHSYNAVSYCVVSYCIILQYGVVLYCNVPYCIVLYCTDFVLYHCIVSYPALAYCTISYCTVSYHIVLCHIISYRIIYFIRICYCLWLFFLTPTLVTNLDKRGLMYMETSALDSTNVEAAFNEILTGSSVSASPTFLSSSELFNLPAHVSQFSPAIQRKVASREVTRGSISAVTLSDTIGPTSESQEKGRGCCKSS